MFENKLIALDFYSTDSFEYCDEKVFRNFISWLENQKIRMYTIEDRVGLNNVDSKDWPTAFEKYLNDLQLRNLTIETEREIQIEILLAHAIRLEYSDNVDTYNNKDMAEETTCQGDQTNVLENIDYNSDEFKSGLSRLQSLLKVPSKHNDVTSILQAISEIISERLTPLALQSFSKQTNLKEANSVQLALKDIELGFDTNDTSVNDAAKILRLLHIKELRKLQTDINETIVVIQAITANPKTDSSLGRVGK